MMRSHRTVLQKWHTLELVRWAEYSLDARRRAPGKLSFVVNAYGVEVRQIGVENPANRESVAAGLLEAKKLFEELNHMYIEGGFHD